MLLLLIFAPLVALIILNLPFGKPMHRAAFWFAAALFAGEMGLPAFRPGAVIFPQMPVYNDSLTLVMLFCIGIVCLSSLAVAGYTIHGEKEKFKFINLLILSSIGMNGIVLVKDLFTLYVFLEITAVSSFILISFKKDIFALEGAFKYLILSAVATIMMLSSIALIMLASPDTSFGAIRYALEQSSGNPLLSFAVAIFLCGLLIKGGIVPFHGWLPDAYMAAPAGVSVLLAGIVTKVSGIYTAARIIFVVFGFSQQAKAVLLAAGAISILVGAFAALGQNNFKRMLAYSSISQVGYMIIGLGAGTALGIAGAIFHIFNHSIFKSLLFVNSAAVEERAGTLDMDRMGGISSKMPVTGTTSVIAMLSACGIPPLAGFWSKLMIIIALWQARHFGYAAIAVIAGVITLAYFLSMQRRVFFGQLAEGLEDLKETHGGLIFVSILLAAITVGAGIFFPLMLNNLILPAGEMISR